jgi:hypothetical protein
MDPACAPRPADGLGTFREQLAHDFDLVETADGLQCRLLEVASGPIVANQSVTRFGQF